MKKAKVTFKTSPVIERYIREIMEFYDENERYLAIGKDGIPQVCSIRTYLPDELVYSNSEDNRKDFIDYFEENESLKLVHVKGIDPDGKHTVDTAELEVYPEEFRVRVLDINSLRNFSIASKSKKDHKVKFDGQTLTYGSLRHTFQKGKKHQESPPLTLFKKLWKDKKQKNTKGEDIDPVVLAMQLLMTQDRSGFNNCEHEFYSLVTNLDKNLRGKGFPLKIHSKGRIQLEIKE